MTLNSHSNLFLAFSKIDWPQHATYRYKRKLNTNKIKNKKVTLTRYPWISNIIIIQKKNIFFLYIILICICEVQANKHVYNTMCLCAVGIYLNRIYFIINTAASHSLSGIFVCARCESMTKKIHTSQYEVSIFIIYFIYTILKHRHTYI